jgi:hypothetical protein
MNALYPLYKVFWLNECTNTKLVFQNIYYRENIIWVPTWFTGSILVRGIVRYINNEIKYKQMKWSNATIARTSCRLSQERVPHEGYPRNAYLMKAISGMISQERVHHEGYLRNAYLMKAISETRTSWRLSQERIPHEGYLRNAYLMKAIPGTRTSWSLFQERVPHEGYPRNAYSMKAITGTRTSWRLSQERVLCTKLDLYVFTTYIYYIRLKIKPNSVRIRS